MAMLLTKRKTYIIFFMLFLVFLLINTTWLWKLMYPIKYEKEIKQYSEQYGLDPYLILAIIQVETGFETDKISKKGAFGLMQLMPETSDWIIEQGRFPEYCDEELLEPAININLGSWYLASIYNKFDNNIVATIAAYNAGPSIVNKWLTNGTWDGTEENINQIPYGETRHYIQRVLYFYDRYQWIYEQDF